jgi:hypothetical protein
MKINLDEIIELVEMHGRTIVDVSMCPDCGGPDKAVMLGKLARMRELIESLPDHVSEEDHENRTVQ